MNKILLFCLLSLLIINVNACFKTKTSSDIVLETREIELNLGDVYQIILEGNATTGYLWSFSVEFDATLFEYTDYKIERDQKENIVGSPEKNIWSFKAIKEGQTNATLIYQRPFEKDQEPMQTIHYKVTILP